VEGWRKRDPLVRFQKYLTEKGFLSGERTASLEEEIKTEIQEAVDRAEQLMKTHVDPLIMFDHAYAEMPPYLEDQKRKFIEELASLREDENHG